MSKGLMKAAKKHELQGFQKNKTLLSNLSALDAMLNDVYEARRPTSQDYDNRRDLVRTFNEMAREIYDDPHKCPDVEEFGSFLMDMFDVRSDLDLSINFRDKKALVTRAVKIEALNKFANKLFLLRKGGHVTKVQPILTARVPVVKATDCGTGIECDLSVENLDGLEKSKIVHMISSIDERFRKLSILIKAWAKEQNINSSKDGTLNSLSLILLAAFHLQTRDNPILPPFSAILKDGKDPMAVKKNIDSFLNFGESNKESLSELFVSLLVKLESVEALWSKGLCASTYKGSWIYKLWEPSNGPTLRCISVEDFTDRSQNTCRVLKSRTSENIYSCIRLSLNHICLFVMGNIDAAELKNLLFGDDPVVTRVFMIDEGASNSKKKKRNRSAKGAQREYQRLSGNKDKNFFVKKSKLEHKNSSGENDHSFPVPTRTIQDSGACVPEATHIDPLSLAALIYLASHLSSVSNQPIQSCEGFRPQSSQFEAVSHIANNFPSAPPISYPPFQGSLEAKQENCHVGTLTYVAPTFAAQQVPVSHPSTQDSRGFGPGTANFESLSHASPNFTMAQTQPAQDPTFLGYGGITSQRSHAENMNHVAPSFSAIRPHHVSNSPISGCGGYRPERTHVENYRYDRDFQPGPCTYPSTYGANSSMPSHGPHISYAPYDVNRPFSMPSHPVGLGRSYDRPSFSSFTSQIPRDFHTTLGDRRFQGHQIFQPPR